MKWTKGFDISLGDSKDPAELLQNALKSRASPYPKTPSHEPGINPMFSNLGSLVKYARMVSGFNRQKVSWSFSQAFLDFRM